MRRIGWGLASAALLCASGEAAPKNSRPTPLQREPASLGDRLDPHIQLAAI